jgi:YVTN family beta-propeller protein
MKTANFSRCFTLLLTAAVGCIGSSSTTGGSQDADGASLPSSVSIAAVDYDALYVINGGDSSISVINTATNKVVSTIMLQNAMYPHHIYMSSDRSSLLVAIPGMDLSQGHGDVAQQMNRGAVLKLDAKTGTTLASRTLDGMNHNAIFSPDGKEVWTSQMEMPGSILVLDGMTLKTTATLAVGDMPEEVTFSADGRLGFVANGMSNNVSVVDPTAKAVVKTVPTTGQGPVGAWPGSAGEMYVDNEQSGSLDVIDTTMLMITRTYNLQFTPGMAAVAPNGELWVSDGTNGKVVYFSANSTSKAGEVATAAGAHLIVFSNAMGKAYVTNQLANSVSVINPVSHVVEATIPVGSKPNGALFRAR